MENDRIKSIEEINKELLRAVESKLKHGKQKIK